MTKDVDVYKNCLGMDDKEWTRGEEIRNQDGYSFKTMSTLSLHELNMSRLTNGM